MKRLWRISCVDILLVFGVGVLFFPMFFKLVTYGWRNADYGHGVFILPVVLGILYAQRSKLIPDKRTKPRGVTAFLAGFLIYLYSASNDFLFLQVTAFIVVLGALFYLRWTSESFQRLLFPLSYLIFMIPPPRLVIDAVTIPLKHISIQAAYGILKSLHWPVAVSGMMLTVGGDQLFVTDACSGFRSISALLALGAVYAYYQPVAAARRWIIFLSVIPLGIAGNILRIVVTAYVTRRFGIAYAQGFFHEGSGIILFVVTVLGLITVSKWAALKNISRYDQSHQEKGSVDRSDPSSLRPSEHVLRTRDVLLGALMIASGVWLMLFPVQKPRPPAAMDLTRMVPAAFGEWASETYDTSNYSDQWQSINQLLVRTYWLKDESAVVDLYVEYSSDVRRAFSFHFPEDCYRAGGNPVEYLKPFDVTLPGGRHLQAKALLIKGMPGQREESDKIVVYWLILDGRQMHETLTIKIDQMLAGLLSKAREGYLVRVDVTREIPGDSNFEPWAHNAIRRYLKDLYEQLPPQTKRQLFGADN